MRVGFQSNAHHVPQRAKWSIETNGDSRDRGCEAVRRDRWYSSHLRSGGHQCAPPSTACCTVVYHTDTTPCAERRNCFRLAHRDRRRLPRASSPSACPHPTHMGAGQAPAPHVSPWRLDERSPSGLVAAELRAWTASISPASSIQPVNDVSPSTVTSVPEIGIAPRFKLIVSFLLSWLSSTSASLRREPRLVIVEAPQSFRPWGVTHCFE